MKGPKIYLVGIPIGNIGDLSPRARAVLEGASRIFCEDTRKLKDLAARAELPLKAKFFAIPGDREFEFDWSREAEEASPENAWVLVSDAGTPVVNDPGRGLIHFAIREGLEIFAIPGPSAPILLWQWSGGFGLPFVFAGFAPKAKRAGAADLDDFFLQASLGGSFCFFDTRHQVLVSLEHLVQMGWGARKLFVAREMTKTHEELIRGTVESVLEILQKRLEKDEPLGELTMLLEAKEPEVSDQLSQMPSLEELLQIRSATPKLAAKVLARITGLKTSEVYEKLIQTKMPNRGPENEN
jgi:16S rRNA (cytidine1402-2'-O)-methyltransferase